MSIDIESAVIYGFNTEWIELIILATENKGACEDLAMNNKKKSGVSRFGYWVAHILYGEKGNWDFQIYDLVKNPDGTDI